MTTTHTSKRYRKQEELEELLDAIDNGVNAAISLRETARPLIERVRNSEACYAMVEEMLLASPQCQKLRDENEHLRAKLDELIIKADVSDKNQPNIFVQIKELEQSISSVDCIKKVRTDFLPPNIHVPHTDNIALFGKMVDSWLQSNTKIGIDIVKREYDVMFRPHLISQGVSVDATMFQSQKNVITEEKEEQEEEQELEEQELEEEEEEQELEEEEEEQELEEEEQELEEEEQEQELEEQEEELAEDEETDNEGPMPTCERNIPGCHNEDKHEDKDEDKDEEVFLIDIEDEDGNTIQYYTNDDKNGNIYECLQNEDVGKKIGKFINEEPEFFT